MPFQVSQRAALVTQATPDYVSGDLCGGKVTFANMTKKVGGNGRLTRLNLLSIDAIAVAAAFLLFSKNPTNSTFTENGAFTIHASDLPYLLDAVPVLSANWVTLTGTAYYRNEIALNIPFQTQAASKDLYGALIAGGTINLSSTASIAAILGGEIFL